MNRGIFWFRRDLRLADHPALDRACRAHDELLLLYIDEAGERAADASRAWLRKSLAALGADIERRGGRLHLLAGEAETLLPMAAAACGANAVSIKALPRRSSWTARALSKYSSRLCAQGVGNSITGKPILLRKPCLA